MIVTYPSVTAFQVGDLVRVKDDLEIRNYETEGGGVIGCPVSMRTNCIGMISRIRSIQYDPNEYLCYTLEEDKSKWNDGDGWYFAASMLELVDETPVSDVSEDDLMEILYA